MPRTCPSCTTSAFDYFAFTVHPADAYWHQVAGGAGRSRDPVDHGRQSVTSLWTYGGSNAAPGLANTEGSVAAQPLVIPVVQGRSQVLSVVLDTATGPQADPQFASWGTFSRIQLIPYIGHRPQPALVLDWQASPFDPDGGTQLHADDGVATIGLAQRQAGASIDATQPSGIWGASALIPGRGANGPYTSVELRFDFALQSWDMRGVGDTPAVAEATGLSLVLLALALLSAWRRPRPPSTTLARTRGGR